MRLCLFLLLAACGTPDRPDGPGPASGTPAGTPVGTPVGPTTVDPYLPDFERELILAGDGPTVVGNIRLAPLDLGPGAELLLADPGPPRLTWVGCDGACLTEDLPLPPDVKPVRTAVADLDGDGDTDIVVASIGELGPSNFLVGSLWIFWRDGDSFTPEQIAQDLPRTVCAEPADLDGDGDLDLTLCLFGHVTVGELAWLEQDGASWIQHTLDPRPGAIHGFPADLDNDGDLDIVAAMAQKTEEVVVHWNDGAGSFTAETIFTAPVDWYGLSGIEVVDLDQDGDLDVLTTNGDSMDSDLPPEVNPNEHYGLRWLDNQGNGSFANRKILGIWGAYSVRATDLDGDGDLDLVLGTFTNTRTVIGPWAQPAEVLTLENDGGQRFSPVEVFGAAPQNLTIELADGDGDGDLEIFSGSMGVDPDQGRDRLVVLWNRWGEP